MPQAGLLAPSWPCGSANALKLSCQRRMTCSFTCKGNSRSSRRCLKRTTCIQQIDRPASAPQDSGGVGRGTAPVTWSTIADIKLNPYKPDDTSTIHLVVAGAGPSGLAVAERVSQAGFRVVVVDPAPLAVWPNNYGVWVDEFEAMGLEDCMEVVWPSATVYLDSQPTGEKNLNRPYARVDRPKLKYKLLKRCLAHGVEFLEAKVEGVVHGGGGSSVSCGGGLAVRGTLALDATGHSRRLVAYDKAFNPGYQGAYGIMAEVEAHPFDLDKMLFMDWRDDHLEGHPEVRERNNKLPTFLYAMPFSPTKVFLEETSLVARPPVPFEDLKERLDLRMAHLGIKVTHLEEEEYCLIPMGGELPQLPQRVLGIGGTGGMVHPATGYMVARMLGSVPLLADAVIEQLSKPSDYATAAAGRVAALQPSEEEVEGMAAEVWAALWPMERIRQREFFLFGMEVLLKLDLQRCRQFFAAFFSLSDFHWQGFLSARLTLPQLLGFGLSLFAKSTSSARLSLMTYGLPGLLVMLSRVGGTFLPKPSKPSSKQSHKK